MSVFARGLCALVAAVMWLAASSPAAADNRPAASVPTQAGTVAPPAQDPPAPVQDPPAPVADPQEPDSEEDDPDLFIDHAQPDFTIVNLPTTLRLPRLKGAFRVTHRFGRPLGQGDFSDLVRDFFGIDSGAQIGLEFRFGLMRGTQIGIYRTSDRTIEFFGQHNILHEGAQNGGGATRPFGLDALVTIEGRENFSEEYSPALAAVVSRRLGARASAYVIPAFVGNTNPFAVGDDSTFMLGVGARIGVGRTVYVTVEVTPRLAGFNDGSAQASVAIEKLVGGHVFQLNVSNSIGTTMGQVASGPTNGEDWYLGFNISRKFY